MAERPNILVLIPHDLGDFLHCYGHQSVRSPNLDAFAAEGVQFTNCFTTCPECSPSRSGLWTGMYPHQNGMMGLSNFGWRLSVPHLAARLRDAGYRTHLFGLQHESTDPATLGYEDIHSCGDRRVGTVCRELADFLRSENSDDGPWFACAGFYDVHRAWPSPSTFDPLEVDVPSFLPDNSTVREDLALFHQNILDMDTAIGGVLEALADGGAEDETLVMFTTDHGAGFPRAKATLYDPGLRVPLLMRAPTLFPGGRRPDCLVSNLDVTSTLLEAAGAPVPAELEGRSFLPLLREEPFEERDAVFGELVYDVSYDPMHYVRTRSHKYVRSFGVTPEEAAGADPDVLCTFVAGEWIRVDDYDVMSSPAWQSMDVDCTRPPREELYDLSADPGERNNLADEPGAAAVLEELRARMDRMMADTASPFLTGHVAPPPEQLAASRKFRPGGPMYNKQ